jgi:hypothetical protein
MKWQDLEGRVRELASYLWDAPAAPDTINGVKCDCVVRAKPDYWHIVEVSEENDLAKLRTDLAKFATVKPYLFSKNIYAECFFVCHELPSGSSLIESGRGQNVKVMCLDEFQSTFFDYQRYCRVRSSLPFGSARDVSSGNKDSRRYVPVQYRSVSRDRTYAVDDIAHLIAQQHRVVLLGNYGTGKSRCVQEVFRSLAQDAAT